MSKGSHIIGKQVIELELRPDQDAVALQQEISWTFRNQIVPRLEALFDRLIDPEISIRIDRLELELPNIDPDQLAYSFTESVLQAVEEAVAEQLAALNVDDPQSRGNRKASRGLTLLESWWYFLERGYLPWWNIRQNPSTWETQIIQELPNQQWAVKQWFAQKRNQPEIIRRLAWQFGEKLHHTLWKILGISHRAMVQRMEAPFLRLSMVLGGNTYTEAQALTYFWECVYARLPMAGVESQEELALLKQYLQLLSQRMNKSFLSLLKQGIEWSLSQDWEGSQPRDLSQNSEGTQAEMDIHGGKGVAQGDAFLTEGMTQDAFRGAKPPYIQVLEPLLLALWKSHQNDDSSAVQEIHAASLPESIPRKNVEEQAKEVAKESEPELTTPKDRPEFSSDEHSIFIENAGMVLIHPFLPGIFSKLGWLENKQFLNEEVQQQALHLLQYLIDGQAQGAEIDMSLNKILCGCPLNQPVERLISLSEDVKAEADRMLVAALEHWKALKTHNPEALQVNFLQREGKLTFQESHWKLFVERKTQDILLGQLPWGISMIKHPWMPDLLTVDWT